MSMKQIKIGYRNSACGSSYTVISVKNTTDHLPGEVLPKREVDALCISPQWDVIIVLFTQKETTP